MRLSAISVAIADGLPRKTVFERVVEAVQKIGFDRVRLDLLSEDGASIGPVAACGFEDEAVAKPVPPEEDSDLVKLRAKPLPQILNGGCAGPEPCPAERGCVPVLLQGELLGKLSVDNARSGKPLELEQMQVAFHFAHQVALAQAMPLDNARLWAESLETLRKTTLAITSARGRDALLKTIIEESVKLLKAKSGGVYEYRPDREELKLIADYNRPSNVGKTLKRGEGLAGRLIDSAEPYMTVEDYNNWPGKASIYAGQRLFGSVLEVPLRWEGKNIGVLYVDDEEGRPFSKTDIRLLRLFADQVAISLVSSILLDQDARKFKRLERLAQATREMMGNLDALSLRERLALIACYATEVLEAETAGVFLARDGQLVLEASHGQPGEFQPGRVKLPIQDEEGSGLTGAIAFRRRLFNAHGDLLTADPAVSHHSPPHTPSGRCYSLLAIPLLQRSGGEEMLVGLVRADNKKGKDGEALTTLGFGQEDEWILAIFAEAAVVAIESAELVNQLKEQGAFRQRLISSSPDGIIAVDRQGRVTEFNKRAEEILGYPRDEVIGLPVAPLYFEPEEPRRIGAKLHQEADHHVRDYETFVRSKVGEKIPIRHASTWLLDAAGERVGSVGYFEDLRSQKALERRESMLLEASTVLAAADNLDEGLQRLVEMMVSELGRSFCGILLMDEDNRSLTLQAEYLDGNPRWRSTGQKIVLAEWEGLSERLAAGRSWTRKRSDSEGRSVLERLARLLGFEKEVKTLLAVPLKIDDRVVGQLDLGDFQGEGRLGFSKEEIDLVSALAAQITVLIQRFQLLETTMRRESLLKALVQASPHIQPGAAIPELQQVIVRLAAELVGCRVGGLFLNRPYRGQLELVAVYGAPHDLVGEHLSHDDELIGNVAKEGETAIRTDPQGKLFRGLNLKVVAVVPFRRGSGEVEAVLFVGDAEGRNSFSGIDREILEAFATQAAIALDTARLMAREQLYGRQLATLRRISDYIQGADTLAKIFHSVLTGITASYGLGFNRAVLMLVDEAREYLVGEMGIGELEDAEARTAWRSATGLDDFERYLRRLEKEEIELTTVGKKTRGLRLPISGNDVFSEVVASGRHQHVSIEQLDRVPQRFLKLFRVRTPLVIVPLAAKGQVIGILAVDNKFTQAPVGDDLSNALMTFASTAAVVIENKRLFDQTRSGAEKLLSFYQMSGELISLQEPRKILERIVEQTVTAAGASWVSILLVDKAGRALNPIQSGRPFSMDPRETLSIRKDGISMEVMGTGQAFRIENVERMRDRINQALMEKSVQAAICLPLSLLGKRIGVMWIHYDRPHRFPDSEVAALQLYVNQAAIAYDSARRLEKLEDIRVTSTALAEVDDMGSVLQRILGGAQQVLKADEAVLWLYDAKTDHFIPESSTYAGEHPTAWSELQKRGPQQRGTAFRIMDRGWMCAEEIQDAEQSKDVGPVTRKFLREIGGRGFQGLALKVGREKLGVLYAIYAKPCQFDEEERETALTFANHAALALKKAKLLDQVKRAREAAEVVARVTLLEDPKNTLLSIAQEIREALGCGAVVLFRYDEETGELLLPTAVTGVRPQRDDKVDYSLPLAMVENDGPYIVPDVAQDERFKNSPFAQIQGIKSCVVIPLQAAGHKVGVMFINYRNPRRFTDDELTNMKLFANQAAVAIRNSQLFEESATKLAQQEALANLSRELLLANSVQETMDRAVVLAAQVLETDFSNIVLPDREGHLLFSAAVGWEQEMVGASIMERGEGSQTGYTIREQKPVAVYDYDKVKDFKVPAVVKEHGIHSGLSVPMFREGKVVGAMLVHTKRPRRFNEDDETLLSLIANQTAIALEEARQYEASQRKSDYLGALYKVSKAITAQVGLEQQQILEQIVQPAMKAIVGIQGPQPVLGTIQLYDEESDKMTLASVYPPERFDEIKERLGERRSLHALLRKGEKIGISGRIVLTGKPKLLRDVRSDPDYIGCPSETLSELAVPLVDRNKVIGVLNVESDQLCAFDEEDEEALKALAELVVVALQNASQVEELKEARQLISNRTTLAWMGLGNAVGRHELSRHVGTLLAQLYLLKKAVEGGETPGEVIKQSFEDIEHKLQEFHVDRPSGSVDEDPSPILVNGELIHACQQRIANRTSRRLKIEICCELDDAARIRGNVQWLLGVLDIFINNAEDAGASTLILGSRASRVRDFHAEIFVADDGSGIPEEVRSWLLQTPAPKREGSRGTGTGLLIAQGIVQIYGGILYYEDREPYGTTMVFSLPLEPSPSIIEVPVEEPVLS